jgi:predicted phage tail protein
MSSTYGYGIGQLPVRMRITPSIITSGSFRVIGGANEAVVIAGNAVYTGPQTYAVQVTATNTFVAAGASLLLQANADAAAFISCSSEL